MINILNFSLLLKKSLLIINIRCDHVNKSLLYVSQLTYYSPVIHVRVFLRYLEKNDLVWFCFEFIKKKNYVYKFIDIQYIFIFFNTESMSHFFSLSLVKGKKEQIDEHMCRKIWSFLLALLLNLFKITDKMKTLEHSSQWCFS